MNVIRSLVGKTPKGPKAEERTDGAAPPNGNAGEQDIIDDNQEERKKLWSKVAGLVGQDITSLVSLPVTLFEPISVLQTMCEPLRYANIVEQVCNTDDAIDRMCLVATFCVAFFAGYTRTMKPFNPLLGETFEYVPNHKRYKSLCEQVSHHPPLSVAYTTADDWSLQQESRIETKFWGNSVDVYSLGNNDLKIFSKEDHYTWTNPATCVHNIIFGRVWIERTGTIPLKNLTTGDTCTINYKKSGWFEGINYEFTGETRDKDGNLRAILSGKYNDSVNIIKVDKNGNKSEPIELWRAPREEITNKWKWPAFVYELTATDEEYERVLAKSDSRWRSDVRALHQLDIKLAGKEKTRIEEVERQKRREREAQCVKWAPLYFQKDVTDKEARWKYIGKYWEDRDQRVAQQNNLTQSVSQASEGLGKVKLEDADEELPEEQPRSP